MDSAIQLGRQYHERRKQANHDLKKALEAYLATVSRRAEVEVDELCRLVRHNACEVYRARAEYERALQAELPPEERTALFGGGGVLEVGPTFADVVGHFSKLRVRRPWAVKGDLLDDGREAMGLYCVVSRFQDWDTIDNSPSPREEPDEQFWAPVRDALAALVNRTRAEWDAEDRAVPEAAKRGGYRAEIKAWIKKKQFGRQSDAARDLGVSLSALTGMMRGDSTRYSRDKLNHVLKRIGAAE